MIKAKRGDVVAIERTRRDYYIGQPNAERTEVTIARVTSCTRDGVAKAFEDARGYRVGDPSGARVLVIPTDKIDPADVLRVAREHHYDGHPLQMRPFDSLDELRAALRPYRTDLN